MRTLTLDDLWAGLKEAERYDAGGEQVARTRRWLDLGDDQPRFAAIANELGENLDVDGVSWDWARIAGLWHLAGDPERAKEWAARASREASVQPEVKAGVLYLIGDYRKTERTAVDAAPVWLAEIARTRDLTALAGVRSRLAEQAMVRSGGPQYAISGHPLTDWDWLEESFALESRLAKSPLPSHEQMLFRSGVFADEPRSERPSEVTPTVGLRVDLASGARLEVRSPSVVELFVPPALELVLRQESGLWGAWVPDDPQSSGRWIVDSVYPDWRHAAVQAADLIAISHDPEAGHSLTRLITEAAGDPGVPLAESSTTAAGAEAETATVPTIEFQSSQIIEMQLADDLFVTLRAFDGGWSASVAVSLISSIDDVIPPSHATWQDAASELATWLESHRGGHGVAELRRLMDQYGGDAPLP